MKLRCENPTIIFNPNLKWLFCCKGFRHADFSGRRLDFDGRKCFYNFPWHDFYVAKSSVTIDNLDQFNLIDDNGEIQPVFMAVPCGKCCLCRDKKCDDWCTRCLCETAASDYPPLFLTLTYKPDCRPSSSEECKDDFQRFMKRLRINVSRHLGVKDHELRYFARSEKTPKHGYWHIHMLLWNMPFVSCAEGDRNSMQTLIKFIQLDCWQNGICRVERCRDATGAYVMKYARKEDCNPDYWQLASRRNGIGNKFAMSLLPTVLQNPDLMSFRIPGQRRQFPIPAYFKRLWFPTLSVLFPADVCKAAKEFMECSTNLYYFMSNTYPDGCRSDDILRMVSDVSDKYRIMHIDFDDARPNRRFCRESDHYTRQRDSSGSLIPIDDRRWSVEYLPHVDSVYGTLYPVKHFVIRSVGSDRPWFIPASLSKASLLTSEAFSFRYGLITQWTTLKRSYDILMKYEFDECEFSRRLALTAEHQEYVRSQIDNFPDVRVADLVAISRRDSDWRETHWMQAEIG